MSVFQVSVIFENTPHLPFYTRMQFPLQLELLCCNSCLQLSNTKHRSFPRVTEKTPVEERLCLRTFLTWYTKPQHSYTLSFIYLFIYLLDFLAFSYSKDDTMRQHRCTETTSTGKTVWAVKARDHFGRTSNHTLEVEIGVAHKVFPEHFWTSTFIYES